MNPTFGNGHALLVGVGADLPGTIDDAAGLADILRDPGRGAYPPAQVRLLTGAQAGRAAVLAALDRLVQAVNPDSTVCVYFSGHGYRVAHPAVGAQYYLMPYGYDTGDLPNTAISGRELAEKLAALRAGKLLLVLDCCHAGGVGEAKAPGLVFTKSPLPPEAVDLLAAGRGRALIASSREDEVSFAGKPYSAFTLALIEALSGVGVAKQDGYTRLADLALHAREVVPGRTQGRQHPVLHFEHADNFAVACYAGGEKTPKGLPFSGEPQIEPDPGAWQGERRAIHTGGGAYIEGSVNTGGGDFVGRDQVKINRFEDHSQDRSIRNYGPVSNSVQVTGDKNRVNTGDPGSREEFVQLLAQMQALLAQAGLPAEERAELQDDLERAAAQAQASQPNKSLILKRLNGVVEFLANSATVLISAPQLLEMARRASDWAQKLF